MEFRRFCASSFLCTSPFAVTTVVGVLDLRKVSIVSSELDTSCSACALKLPNQPQTYALLCFGYQHLRLHFHKRTKRSFVLGVELTCIFSPNPMLLCGHTLLVLRFPQVFFPQTWIRKDWAHESSPLWTTSREFRAS